MHKVIADDTDTNISLHALTMLQVILTYVLSLLHIYTTQYCTDFTRNTTIKLDSGSHLGLGFQ